MWSLCSCVVSARRRSAKTQPHPSPLPGWERLVPGRCLQLAQPEVVEEPRKWLLQPGAVEEPSLEPGLGVLTVRANKVKGWQNKLDRDQIEPIENKFSKTEQISYTELYSPDDKYTETKTVTSGDHCMCNNFRSSIPLPTFSNILFISFYILMSLNTGKPTNYIYSSCLAMETHAINAPQFLCSC